MTPLPAWMRAALLATAVMNIIGSAVFLPSSQPLRDLGGLPNPGHPLYVATVGIFILVLGLGYLGCAIMNRADRLFIAVGATGKLAFVALLVELWFTGDLPLQAMLAGAGDFVFGVMFAVWLVRTRAGS